MRHSKEELAAFAAKHKVSLIDAAVFLTAAELKRGLKREIVQRDAAAIWRSLLDGVPADKMINAVSAFSYRLSNLSALNQRLASLELVPRYTESVTSDEDVSWM